MKNAEFTHIRPEQLGGNVFEEIGKKWMLITAGTENGYNTMTASWGAMGVMWNKPVAIAFIRPQRYTKEFVDREPLFTSSFFPETYRAALNFCGKHSGRDFDKAKVTGLTPVFGPDGGVYFSEAETVLLCRKLYVGQIRQEGFIVPELLANYPAQDYHAVYFGEILDVLRK